jgi:lipopolysaccharide transport system ATP-binding protein
MSTDAQSQASTVEDVITLAGVSKEFSLGSTGGRRLFRAASEPRRLHKAVDDVSFAIKRGETVGLLGTNGAGKSTLLQLITGTLSPTRGHVRVVGRISALLELGAGFNPDWSGRQNAEFQAMIYGAKPAEIPGILARVEAFADIGQFFEQPMKMYSSGMFARVAFAAAIATEPDILIVDEALAVGDSRFQNKCFAHFRDLQEKGKTILFVSHDTTTVSQFCTRGIVIDQGKVVFDGTSDNAVAAYLKLLYGNAEPVRLAPRVKPIVQSADPTLNVDAIAALFSWPPDGDVLPRRGYYNPHSASAGRVVGHIVDVLVLDGNNQPLLGPIQSGERFRIAIQIVSDEAIEQPGVGITLKSKDNTLIFGVRNAMLGQELSMLPARTPLVAVFEINNALASGDYFVDIGLNDLGRGELVVIEWRVSLLHLSVVSRADHYGIIDLGATFASTLQSDPRKQPSSPGCPA